MSSNRKRAALRKANDVVARLKIALEMEKGLLTLIRLERDELRDAMEEVHRIADKFSILTPPVTITNVSLHTPYTVGLPTAASFDGHLVTAVLQKVEAFVRAPCAHKAIHAKLVHLDGSVCYALSDEAVAMLTRDELLWKFKSHVLPNMARELADQMKGKR